MTGPALNVTATGATLDGYGRSARAGDDLVVPVRRECELRRQDRHEERRLESGPQNVGAAVAGLKNGTTYHYRLVATSDAGTTYGSDLTFATRGVTIAAGGREVIFGGRVTLSGAVPTHGVGEQVTVFAQAYGRGSPVSVATVLTGSRGGLELYRAAANRNLVPGRTIRN